MSSPALGRLVRADLRTAWMSEPADFTPWLAQQENLQLLGETIGIELELESQEKPVGPFSADILAKTQRQVTGCSSRTSSNVPTTPTSAS